MSRWQYRVRGTNLNRYGKWLDVRETANSVSVLCSADLQFRRKPGPFRSLVAAALRRAGGKQQRGESRDG